MEKSAKIKNVPDPCAGRKLDTVVEVPLKMRKKGQSEPGGEELPLARINSQENAEVSEEWEYEAVRQQLLKNEKEHQRYETEIRNLQLKKVELNARLVSLGKLKSPQTFALRKVVNSLELEEFADYVEMTFPRNCNINVEGYVDVVVEKLRTRLLKKLEQ